MSKALTQIAIHSVVESTKWKKQQILQIGESLLGSQALFSTGEVWFSWHKIHSHSTHSSQMEAGPQDISSYCSGCIRRGPFVNTNTTLIMTDSIIGLTPVFCNLDKIFLTIVFCTYKKHIVQNTLCKLHLIHQNISQIEKSELLKKTNTSKHVQNLWIHFTPIPSNVLTWLQLYRLDAALDRT